MKLFAGPVMTETANVTSTRTSSLLRKRGPTAPRTGVGWSAAASATKNRLGSSTHPRTAKTTTSGTTASVKMPRKPSAPEARLCTIAASPAPSAYPAAMSAMAAARSEDAVSSAAITSARALVALSRGRPKAKIATNHQ